MPTIPNIQLTDHFSLAEMLASQEATRRCIDNTPSEAIVANLKRICATLEEVRALVGQPLHVSSGYRCEALNKAIGGSTTSAHCKGLAADINVNGYTPRELAVKIRDSGIKFDQLIFEGTWVHIGLADGALRQQVLTAVFYKNQPTTYRPGII